MKDEQRTGDPVLGAALRQIRTDAGLTQAQLAERLGIGSVQVSRVETGSRSTSADVLQRWYEACGYKLDAVQIGTPEQATSLALALALLPKSELDAVLEVVTAWPALPERVRGRILGMISVGGSHQP